MTWPRIARVLFQQKFMLIWLSIPIVYGFTTFFQVPAVYNTKFLAYFFDPFAGIEGLQGLSQVIDNQLFIEKIFFLVL